MGSAANRPIIIKRKKVSGDGGHHGGAWKVAYADFVTAMMAFFMLMWLLNATSEQQRAGLADYFAPTFTINRTSGGGEGMFGGESIFSEQKLSDQGHGDSRMHASQDQQGSDLPEEGEASGEDIAMVKALENMDEELLGRGGESAFSEEALRHVVTRLSDEGLTIELYDRPEASLFEEDSARPTPIAVEIGRVIANYLAIVENPLVLQAHVRAQPIVRLDNTVWQLSIDRATQMRILLEAGGYDPEKIMRVTGEADRDPVSSDPTSLRNNRIEIVVLRGDL